MVIFETQNKRRGRRKTRPQSYKTRIIILPFALIDLWCLWSSWISWSYRWKRCILSTYAAFCQPIIFGLLAVHQAKRIWHTISKSGYCMKGLNEFRSKGLKRSSSLILARLNGNFSLFAIRGILHYKRSKGWLQGQRTISTRNSINFRIIDGSLQFKISWTKYSVVSWIVLDGF